MMANIDMDLRGSPMSGMCGMPNIWTKGQFPGF